MTQTRARLVFIITGLSTGGSETMLLKLLERIDRRRFQPHVFSLSGKGEIGPRIEALGIPVEALGMRPGLPSPLKFHRLVSRLRELQPDMIHTWMYHADLVGSLAARFAGVSTVGWRINHSNLDRALNKRTTLWIVSLCARLSHRIPKRILSCSEKAREVHVAAGYAAGKMLVVPNGFDLGRFRPDAAARESVRQELGLGTDVPLVGIVGRYNSQKNVEGFVDAAGAVARSRSDVHFLLAGTGLDAANAALARAVSATAVADRVHLLGRRDDIPRLMAALDVFALSSHGEAFPNVVGEAMACGVPCVVTDAGDAAEIVGDTGKVVPTGDMAGLAREILGMLELPPAARVALGQRARDRVRDKYDIERVVEQYQEFYESMLKESEPCAA
jgi:glycosyltransferase involved in cell wall biosynthesis